MARKKKKLFDMENEEEERPQGPSRSARKRESSAMQKLGENLAKLKPEARRSLPMSDDLLQALDFHDSLTDREAARRQRQFIGKLMREEDVPAIMAALARLESPQAARMARFHAAENWREKLLSSPETEKMAEDFFRALPCQTENGEKKDLISLAQRARQAGGSDPALKRNLFRQILALLEKDGS